MPKIIKIDDCSECPYVEKIHCGEKLACNHPKVQVLKPYQNDRVIPPYPPGCYPSYCPLQDDI